MIGSVGSVAQLEGLLRVKFDPPEPSLPACGLIVAVYKCKRTVDRPYLFCS